MANWLASLLIAIAIATTATVKHFFPRVKDDNPVEEITEQIFKDKLGAEIDLSPMSGDPDRV